MFGIFVFCLIVTLFGPVPFARAIVVGCQASGKSVRSILSGYWTASGSSCDRFVLGFDKRGILTRYYGTERLMDEQGWVVSTFPYELSSDGRTLTIHYGLNKAIRSVKVDSKKHIWLMYSRPDNIMYLARCRKFNQVKGKIKAHSRVFASLAGAEKAKKTYVDKGLSFTGPLQKYHHLGDYLNYGLHMHLLSADDRLKIGEDGVVRVRYGNEFYFNPVTASWQALNLFGKYLRGSSKEEEFLNVAYTLLDQQDQAGGFPYDIAYYHYPTQEHLAKGWYSGLAQGASLSVFSRAYALTKDTRFLEAGDKAFALLTMPVEEGGVASNLGSIDPQLEGYFYFEEYPTNPPNHVLNGFVYAVIGVHDWWKLKVDVLGDDSETQREWLTKVIDSLERILPLYDINGFAAYDLTWVTWNTPAFFDFSYQRDHIVLMEIMYQISGRKIFREYARRWANGVGQLKDFEDAIRSYETSPLILDRR